MADALTTDPRLQAVIDESMHSAAVDAAEWTRDFIETRRKECGSPIEELFLAAVAPYIVMSDEYAMKQQVEIGRYRVDFVVWYYRDTPDQIAVVVECDGHDFHERTKEQARRDKSRDRFLQARGYFVLRFTGSELWADPAECVSEVIDLTQCEMERRYNRDR